MAIIEVGKRLIQARTNSLHEEIDLDELETEKPKPKLEVAAQMGFNKNQVAQFQKLANNPDAAETEKFIAEKAAAKMFTYTFHFVKRNR